MHFLRRCITKLKSYTALIYRKEVIEQMRCKNEVEHVSIISSNCIGGILSHDLGIRFESPTINLFFSANDFIKFVKNLKYYLSIDFDYFEKSERGGGYPVGHLEDITIHFVHYKTEEECKEKWNRRKLRVDFDNILLIFTDRNGLTTEMLQEFLNLPYKKLVYVSKKEMCITNECIYVPGFEKEKNVGEMDKYADWTGHRYYEKYVDIVGWLNSK